MDLLTAAVHARAAYGYAMAAGHLSSISKFAMLHTVLAHSKAPPCSVVRSGATQHEFAFCAMVSTAQSWPAHPKKMSEGRLAC